MGRLRRVIIAPQNHALDDGIFSMSAKYFDSLLNQKHKRRMKSFSDRGIYVILAVNMLDCEYACIYLIKNKVIGIFVVSKLVDNALRGNMYDYVRRVMIHESSMELIVHTNYVCNHCSIVSFNSQRCSRCRDRVYCSVECQRKDWVMHKSNCWSHILRKILFRPNQSAQDGRLDLLDDKIDTMPNNRTKSALFAKNTYGLVDYIAIVLTVEEHDLAQKYFDVKVLPTNPEARLNFVGKFVDIPLCICSHCDVYHYSGSIERDGGVYCSDECWDLHLDSELEKTASWEKISMLLDID